MPRRAGRRARTRSTSQRPRRNAWARWKTDQLLDLRMRDLDVRLEGTWLAGCVEKLYVELDRRGFRLRPHVWISHDWFSPDNVPGIAVPFYLTHPRLMRLERDQMLEVEGGTAGECIRILRHECGHALQHAYRLHRRRRWREHFGSASRKYPDVYRPNPASKRFVQHLRLYYAQSHPVEDFAETFAVWLTPRALWRKRYAGWPALKKLEYVDELMEEIKNARPAVRNREQVDPLSKLRTTLREHYEEKRRQYAPRHPDIYDGDLRRLFSEAPKDRNRELASSFLRRNRTKIRRMVSRWTGEYQFTLDQVLSEMIGRCRELRLRAAGPERKLRTDFALLLTVKAMQTLYRRRNWIAL